MTDLWLHVNTFFIIVLIFFRYSSYIKKYMAAYFICLRKLLFCGDDSFKIILRFLKFFLPGTAKAVPSKLCTVFLCILLNRLRFSLQNVEFGTKSTPSVAARQLPQGGALTLSVIAARCQLPRRGSFSTLSQSFPPPLKPSPWGRWLDAKRQDGRGSPLDSGLALSGAPAPALPTGEPSRKACC